VWVSINANQLPPSGSSIFHPHLQGSAHPVPTTAQRAYAELELGFQSFNLAIHGAATGDPDPRLALRVVARTYFGPLQRSDVMWSERLYGELATDIRPEKLADLARDLFAST
jgi:galactose-1-phosphate uridylyltransferase